ncbi:CgeB family protein [Lysobacter tyrosinilyticus]
MVLYNHDDPSGRRDGQRFGSLLAAIRYYDLCAVCRDVNVEEFNSLGARDVIRFVRGYDEVAHKGFESESSIPNEFRSDVAFVGTWMRHERRDEFLLRLVESGVRPAIWGARWEKSPSWNDLKMFYRGGPLAGREYVAALQGAKISLGMLSKGNRDFSTTRSAEIPYAMGLLCAERTAEHQQMYREGVEAVYWSDARECAEVCARLLSDEGLRESIRAAGHRRVLDLRIGNEDVCGRILERSLA